MQEEMGPLTEAEQVANELREMAAFFEAHPELPRPSGHVYVFLKEDANPKETLRTVARAGGVKYADGIYFGVKKSFGSVCVAVLVNREAVCERRQVGTKVIPAVKAREVPVYEWNCEPLLKD
jgi:hypothetical protein